MKKIGLIIIVFLFMIGVTGCNNKEEKGSSTQSQYRTIFEENNYVIVDVRSSNEYEINHVVGAVNIPLNDITENINLDKSKTIFVYCFSGSRSKEAYDLLKDYGYTVYDLGAFDSITLDKIK